MARLGTITKTVEAEVEVEITHEDIVDFLPDAFPRAELPASNMAEFSSELSFALKDLRALPGGMPESVKTLLWEAFGVVPA